MNQHLERRLMLKGIATVSLMGSVAGSLPRRALAQGTPAGAGAKAAAPVGKLVSIRSTARSWLWRPEDYAFGAKFFEKSGLIADISSTNRGVNQDALLSGAADILLGAPTQNMRVQIRKQPVSVGLEFCREGDGGVVDFTTGMPPKPLVGAALEYHLGGEPVFATVQRYVIPPVISIGIVQ